jgi:asparagine synthase (glutamine-hydrolysing)
MKTTSDTELLIELYAKLGPGFLEHLNGMFTLVILDKETGQYFAARDRLGIKPLYHYEDSRGIILSSEISPILKLVGEVPFDNFALRQYRKMRTFYNGRTPYKGVSMFPAAHTFDGKKYSQYWSLPEERQTAPSHEEIRDLVESAVSLRCISDVPVGSYLSGGLDSTIVAGLSDKPHTWTVGFGDFNEFAYAREAADKFGSQHHEVLVQKEDFLETARTMIQERKEPLSVPNEVLLFLMTQQVKTENTVVLSGEGADELFFGYDRIFRWANQSAWDLTEFAKNYSYGTHEDADVVEDAVSPFLDNQSCLTTVARFFQISHLHGLLRRLDNSTMLCSVEARVPFVDHRIIERLAGVSFDDRMPNGVVKGSLKEAFSDLVPHSIIHRKKVGFPVPLSDIFYASNDQTTSAMDQWLLYNLQVLTGEKWPAE